jgi:hypothetical protein
LIANRLTHPQAMVGVADWAQDWAVEEVYGLPADALNDDRLGWALDAVAPQVEHIIGSVGARAIDAFGIEVTRLHWDMTSISLYGAYDSVDADHPAPAYGHPKDRRTDLKQIQAGIGAAADGGIPVFHRAYDGGAGEVAQVVDTMKALKAMAGPRSFLLVGDSKLISYTNVTAMLDAGVTFIAPLAAARVPAGLFTGIDRAAATPVDYIAPRTRRGHTPVARGRLPGHRGRDDPARPTQEGLRPPTPPDPGALHRQRRRRRQGPHPQLAQARTELDTLTRTAGTRYHPTVQAVTAKAAEIARRRRVTAYLQTTITTTPEGTPTFGWTFDQHAIDADTASDGWYALLTNLTPDTDTAEVFHRYKDQPVIEQP